MNLEQIYGTFAFQDEGRATITSLDQEECEDTCVLFFDPTNYSPVGLLVVSVVTALYCYCPSTTGGPIDAVWERRHSCGAERASHWVSEAWRGVFIFRLLVIGCQVRAVQRHSTCACRFPSWCCLLTPSAARGLCSGSCIPWIC